METKSDALHPHSADLQIVKTLNLLSQLLCNQNSQLDAVWWRYITLQKHVVPLCHHRNAVLPFANQNGIDKHTIILRPKHERITFSALFLTPRVQDGHALIHYMLYAAKIRRTIANSEQTTSSVKDFVFKLSGNAVTSGLRFLIFFFFSFLLWRWRLPCAR